MPLVNPSSLYTGGKFSMNPLPYLQIAERHQAAKQAKDEALDKYFGNLPNTINEKGLRDQEVPILHAQKDAMQQYWMENAPAIKKGNTPEAHTMGKMFRDAQGVVDKSLNNTATNKVLSQWHGDPKKQYIFHNPNVIEALRRNELPVTHPDYLPINLAQLDIPPAPFQEKELDSYYTGKNALTPMVDKIEEKDYPDDRFKKQKITTYKFDDNALSNIYHDASNLLEESPSFAEHLKKLDPLTVKKIDENFQKHYGYVPRSDQDVAAAYNLTGRLSQLTPKTELIPNTAAKNAEWDRRHAINFADSMKKIKANKASGVDPNTGYISDNVADDAGEILTIYPEKGGSPDKKTVVYVDKVDPGRLDIITGRDLSKKRPGVTPVDIKQPDGSIKKGYYVDQSTGDWIGKDGQKISREAAKDRYINTVSPTKFKTQIGTKAEEIKPSSGKKSKYDKYIVP